ncbi:MAG: 4Fe-4S dicluster domain-containing protein [Pyrobaculum sp.]|jgi:NADH-quinone oxidoreductase subunit I|nr:4Fe-4S dicluster domain-containing protein [Pyrobaculum sp.]
MITHLKLFATAVKQLLQPPLTVRWPEERRNYGDRMRGFIVNDRSKCISCQLCEAVCPAKAIKFHLEADGRRYPGIDWGRCILCGYCVDACPTGSLQHVNNTEIVWTDLDVYKKPSEMDPDDAAPLPGTKLLV